MKKRFFSLFLSLVMVISLGSMAFAADYKTTVVGVGGGSESYTINVPSTLSVGVNGTISASGTWSADKTLKISAPSTVTLSNGNIDLTGTVICTGLSIAGNDYGTTVSGSTNILIECDSLIPAFGTYTGTMSYIITMD